jgi:hypothetical protein
MKSSKKLPHQRYTEHVVGAGMDELGRVRSRSPQRTAAAARFGFERGTAGRRRAAATPEACLACPSSPYTARRLPAGTSWLDAEVVAGGTTCSVRKWALAPGSSRVSMSAELRQETAKAGEGGELAAKYTVRSTTLHSPTLQ